MTISASGLKHGVRARLLEPVAYILGYVLIGVGGTMTAAAGVGLLHSEFTEATWIGLAAAITVVTGWVLARKIGRPAPITVKIGFAAVGLSWFVISAFGSLPFLLTGSIDTLTNAYFETASGFTTTGATILPDPSILARSLLFWRSATHWLGGMGVIVLSVAILPLLGTGGVQLARAESTGHMPDRLTPRFRDTAKRLWLLYALLTIVQSMLLWAGEMDLFEAVTHTFSTVSTGGFGTRPDSIAGFSPYTQWVIVAFMFVAGASFALHWRAFRRPSEYWTSTEFRLYTLITVIAVIVVAGGLMRDLPFGDAVRHATFTTVSVITTTGFTTENYGAWRPALQVAVFGLMFVGGMAGSTAGAVKTFRIGILSKAAISDIRRLVHPRGIFTLRFGRERVSESTVEAIQSFFLFYMFIFMTATFLTTFIDANLSERLDLVSAASSVAATLGNVGPGLGTVGPAGSYAELPDLVKWLQAGLMIIGRLEIFPVLVLFTRDLWRR